MKQFTTYKEFKEVPTEVRAYITLKDGVESNYFIKSNDTDSKIIYTVESVLYYDKIKEITIYD